MGLRDNTKGVKLSGFHCSRHTIITFGMQHKIPGIFSITGHKNSTANGFGVVSELAKGYWTQGLTYDIQEKQKIRLWHWIFRPLAG